MQVKDLTNSCLQRNVRFIDLDQVGIRWVGRELTCKKQTDYEQRPFKSIGFQ